MLQIRDLQVCYGDVPALQGLSLEVNDGEVVAVLGPNGAGKTTLLNTISGLIRPKAGAVTFEGRRTDTASPSEIVTRGIIHVPEGRQVFPDLTVYENLEVGSVRRKDRPQVKKDIEELMGLFPELNPRRKQLAGTLSGGEQQMLATARALIAQPRLLMIDEPSMGLAPVVIQRIFRFIRDEIVPRGITVLLVEQNAYLSLAISNRAYLLHQGTIALSGNVSDLLKDDRVKQTYFRGQTARGRVG